MKVFFDTEFTGLHKNTTLLSIGLVAENNKTFYAEFTDYDNRQVDDWIKQNVISKMAWGGTRGPKRICLNEGDNITVLGDKGYVASKLTAWLNTLAYSVEDTQEHSVEDLLAEPVELVSDCCHYDMVLFIDIFGDAFDIPTYVAPVCYDINQDIARYLNVSAKLAFDVSREWFLKEHDIEVSDDKKHNALFDARVIWAIYNVVKNG